MKPHAACLPDIPGWFGKIPSLGDFAVRRLPPGFVKPWDEWLSAELSAARSILADDWAATYRQAPMLCFSLAAGVLDEHIWNGVLVPSFDRVGREFPLTIAQGRPQYPALAVERQWWAALATTGRRALEPGCGAEGLETALALLVEHQPAPGHAAEPDIQHMATPPAGTPVHTTDILSRPGDGKSAWSSWPADGNSAWWHWPGDGKSTRPPWCVNDSPDGAPAVFSGLPRGVRFRNLLGAP
jgi:type VI secretion system protein ImpM